MKVTIVKLPDISDYMQFIVPLQLSSDVSIICVFKQLFRDDDVLVDFYLSEIADNTKIVSGVKLTSNSLLCLPHYDLGFIYSIYCLNIDNINEPVTKNNVHKFYFQFVTEDGVDWDINERI